MRNMSFPHARQCAILTLMNPNIQSLARAPQVFVVRSPGVEMCVLRAHAEGSLTCLIRMQKGARAQRHGHPGGEETFVLTGKLHIDRRVDAEGTSQPDTALCAGDYFFAPAGETHQGYVEEDTTFLVLAAGGLTAEATQKK